MKIISAEENFQEFAARLYEQPGVADLCLTLQDEQDADVNMLLFACWYGATRGEMDSELFAQALAFSASWSSEVTWQLRGARRWMKQNPPESADDDLLAQFRLLRERIKKTELEAEQFQENMLESLIASPAQPLSSGDKEANIRHNLGRYARHIGMPDSRAETMMAALARATGEVT